MFLFLHCLNCLLFCPSFTNAAPNNPQFNRLGPEAMHECSRSVTWLVFVQFSVQWLQSEAATCSEGFVKCFLRVPQAIGHWPEFPQAMLPKQAMVGLWNFKTLSEQVAALDCIWCNRARLFLVRCNDERNRLSYQMHARPPPHPQRHHPHSSLLFPSFRPPAAPLPFPFYTHADHVPLDLHGRLTAWHRRCPSFISVSRPRTSIDVELNLLNPRSIHHDSDFVSSSGIPFPSVSKRVNTGCLFVSRAPFYSCYYVGDKHWNSE